MASIGDQHGSGAADSSGSGIPSMGPTVPPSGAATPGIPEGASQGRPSDSREEGSASRRRRVDEANRAPPLDVEGLQRELQRLQSRMQDMENERNSNQGSQRNETGDDRKERGRVVLDEKYFRRIERFDGDITKFRGWMFDLLVAIGQVNEGLGKDLEELLRRDIEDVQLWDPEDEDEDFQQTYDKFRAELYGIIVSLTVGEAKNVIKGIGDFGRDSYDGYKALIVFESET